MSAQAENWFRELIKDMIVTKAELSGGYLDGTMMGGDEEAGTYKFPVFGGNIETVELSGAIEDVTASDAELTTIQMSPKDYEAAIWHRKQDLYKMGPKHQDALASAVTRSIMRRKDTIKWQALYDFTSDVTFDIGGDAVRIDPRYLEQARGEIEAEGEIDELGRIAMPVPHRWLAQLNGYDVWSDADKVGTDNLPYSQAAMQNMRDWQGVHVFAVPDKFFTFDETGTGWCETFMWAYNAVGAETPWDGLPPSITKETLKAGSPWLIKAGVGGCAVGLRRKAVKKLRFKAPLLAEPVPQLTQAA